MNRPNLSRAVGAVRDVCDHARHVLSGGVVQVVALQCRDCGRWVKPGDWNPASAVCEPCAAYAARVARARKFPNSDPTLLVGGGW